MNNRELSEFNYEVEVSKLLNDINPLGRKAIESNLIFIQAVKANDFQGAYQFVYDWLHGKSKSKAGLRRELKRRKQEKELWGEK